MANTKEDSIATTIVLPVGEEKHYQGSKAERDDGHTLHHLQQVFKQMPDVETLDLGRLDLRQEFLPPLAAQLAAFTKLTTLKLSPPRDLHFWTAIGRSCIALRKLVLLPSPVGAARRRSALTGAEFVLSPSVHTFIVKHRIAPSALLSSLLGYRRACQQAQAAAPATAVAPAVLHTLSFLWQARADDRLVATALKCFPMLKTLKVHSHDCDGNTSLAFVTHAPRLTSLHLVGLQWSISSIMRRLTAPAAPKLQRLVLHCGLSAFLMMKSLIVAADSLHEKMNGCLSALFQYQSEISCLDTNLIRSDAELPCLRLLTQPLQQLTIRDCVPGSSQGQCDALRFTAVAWHDTLASCPEISVWAMLSSRDTGIRDLADCLPVANKLEVLSVKLDGTPSSCKAIRAAKQPALNDIRDLQLHGASYFSWDTLVALFSSGGGGSLVGHLTLVVSANVLAFWTEWPQLLPLPTCQSLHLRFVTPQPEAVSPLLAPLTVNVDAWIRAVRAAGTLPMLTSLTLTSDGQPQLLFTDLGAHELSQAWPYLKQCTVWCRSDDNEEEKQQSSSALLTMQGVQKLIQLEQLATLRLCPCPPAVKQQTDLDELKIVRDELWARASVAPSPLRLQLGMDYSAVL